MADLLYHYTTIDALQKILQDYDNTQICVWATHSLFLNDPLEYKYALDVLKRDLEKYELQQNISNENRKLKMIFPDDKEGLIGLVARATEDSYLVSFSEKSDSLTMWRSYSKNGFGVAIGFDKQMLAQYSSELEAELIRCDYSDDDNILTKEFWNKHYEHFVAGKWGMDTFDPIFSIIKMCASIKQSQFYDENEIRLFSSNHLEYEVRTRGDVMIPYVKHFLPKSIIKEIVLGPCVEPGITKKGIEMYLKKHTSIDINLVVRNSKISYRPN